MGVPAPALNLVERSIWERRGIRRSVVKTGLNAYAPGRYPTFARATGVSWMLGIGRLGSILGSSIGGLLLGFGWDFRGIFCALAVPAADRRGGNPDQRTAIDAATSTTSDEIIAMRLPSEPHVFSAMTLTLAIPGEPFRRRMQVQSNLARFASLSSHEMHRVL
ncbi:hypothetical protein [Rhizobium leucaenae]|uniref:hypothetical protein n=1 Tax=Rhizobium leucaenae TaxID=29450 RepID=UPI0017F8647F|nr:hypothetical protein [Rhizobium leucaenae]MBB6302844.1 MFS family permease [Rhizobium leucaenae]